MSTSRKILVRKRDGSFEPFDEGKLAATLSRALQIVGGRVKDGWELSRAIRIYLTRTGRHRISSAAIFEMVLKALRRIRRGDAAEVLELHRTLRSVRRPLLRIRHDDGCQTVWDKSWLAILAGRMWHLSRTVSRMLAGEVELMLLPQEDTVVDRREIIDRLNDRVAAWGLADAVPVDLPAAPQP